MVAKFYKNFDEWWNNAAADLLKQAVLGQPSDWRNICLEAWDIAVQGTWKHADEDIDRLKAEVERLRARVAELEGYIDEHNRRVLAGEEE